MIGDSILQVIGDSMLLVIGDSKLHVRGYRGQVAGYR